MSLTIRHRAPRGGSIVVSMVYLVAAHQIASELGPDRSRTRTRLITAFSEISLQSMLTDSITKFFTTKAIFYRMGQVPILGIGHNAPARVDFRQLGLWTVQLADPWEDRPTRSWMAGLGEG